MFPGCTVIAFAGSDEKVAWVKELGADHSFNYKTTNVAEALSKVAPKGVNLYFDNVSSGALFLLASKDQVNQNSKLMIPADREVTEEKAIFHHCFLWRNGR